MSLEDNYKKLVAQSYIKFQNKIDKIDSKEIKDFFSTIIDAAERSLRGLLFQSPDEFNFSKDITVKDIDFWIRKTSRAFISYSYYFYSDSPQIKNSDIKDMTQESYEMWWQVIFNNYDKVFGESINMEIVNYYAAGLKEDFEKKYSASDNIGKAMELSYKDAITIATELVKNVWHENITQKMEEEIKAHRLTYGSEKLNPEAKKILFVGIRIWQAYQQIIQPFLAKLLTEY